VTISQQTNSLYPIHARRMFWDNPWTLTIGGAIVGYLTNWIALKCIFEPVEPVTVGPFVLQVHTLPPSPYTGLREPE
jgi:hypothetical protein